MEVANLQPMLLAVPCYLLGPVVPPNRYLLGSIHRPWDAVQTEMKRSPRTQVVKVPDNESKKKAPDCSGRTGVTKQGVSKTRRDVDIYILYRYYCCILFFFFFNSTSTHHHVFLVLLFLIHQCDHRVHLLAPGGFWVSAPAARADGPSVTDVGSHRSDLRFY